MSKCELIELKDLSVNDPIDLAVPAAHSASPTVNPGPPGHSRTVRLAGHNVSIKAPLCHTGEAGAGHNFQPYSHTHLTWCDLCGEFIWGLYKQSLHCSNCRYTCHHRCRPFIQLDCNTDGRLLTDQADVSFDSIETDTNVDEDQGEDKHKLTISEIQQKVQEYNALTNSNLWMVLNKDGSYTGFIKVHFQLLRPISLPPPQRPCSAQYNDLQCDHTTRRTSFYLPKDTAKHLHISSQTPAYQVIEALLNKFTLVDNPAKFALFERTERQNQVYLRKLADDECPLCLRLCAGPSEKILSLLLKENETGDVNWDAFSFPELCNFLRILQREEEEYVQQIVKRYAVARNLMEQALMRITTPG
ncbi:ras association domain-containing protein 1 [Thalassophryne amazonica]|uniref:ras association domain-containing protein 1 n=1 Tax=Thalassophryne amazonica TaxID=390379 RepID=UPI001471783C|nr:ras association domain-containing protein 1 [Thalassophryne amazonica]